ncbi:MAG: protein kinase domain-containing protein, partial [Planctomycetota bacterium]
MNGRLTAEEIFHAAREKRDPAERAGFLDGACGNDVSLRAKVEALLKAEAEAGEFLRAAEEATQPFLSPAPTLAETPRDQAGDMFGRYKLLQQIGEGGFGVVYMAEQREPVKRRVALKIIKLGMDTRQVIARFEAERQALAMMDHPNIAKVLDAGSTETGRLYFVMEYIRGVPILEYCDTEKLDIGARLELFTTVCHAIQHAHQKGIIHRDIKPGNVLVTMHDGVPVPKVIDFGIAKATSAELTAKTLFTEHRQMIGTPAYMSPEQAEMSGLDIDTRSDIYSLGVLLYELLTGTTPYELLTGTTPFTHAELMSKGFAEIMRVIREVEPHKPSTRLSSLGDTGTRTAQQRRAVDPKKLSQTLRGDLDWIIMKCLEKDRTRRYETANGLAMDIRRYLGGEAIVAAPPSAAYRLKKFIRRHRVMVTAGSAVAAALLIGIIAFAWQSKIAWDQRDLAVQARQTAQDAQAAAAAQQQRAEAERDRAEVQLTRAEGLVYAGRLMLAQTDFEAGNGGLALHYLGECQRNLRGWEWRYLWTRIDAKRTLVGHRREVSSVAISPDGRRIVTGSEDKTAKVWDATTSQELLTLEGHDGYVLSVAFSPDGQRIVTGGGPWGKGKHPGEVNVWDAATGRLLHDLQGHTYCVWSVAFSPDGRRIITSAGDWAYGPGEVKLWDAVTGQEALTLTGHARGVRAVTFSPDGQRIVTGSEDLTARVWDAATGQVLHVLEHTNAVSSVAFSPDGRRIVTGIREWGRPGWKPGEAKVWDAATGQELLTLEGHKGLVLSAAFSPDGERIITGGGPWGEGKN